VTLVGVAQEPNTPFRVYRIGKQVYVKGALVLTAANAKWALASNYITGLPIPLKTGGDVRKRTSSTGLISVSGQNVLWTVYVLQENGALNIAKMPDVDTIPINAYLVLDHIYVCE
jgi:hypothetical protein